jgi:hypothetical protein
MLYYEFRTKAYAGCFIVYSVASSSRQKLAALGVKVVFAVVYSIGWQMFAV